MMDELQQFVKVIEWLDQARWNQKNADWWGSGWRQETVRSLPADQKVLLHWITYITDMQMSADYVWSKGLPVFAVVVKQYSEGKDPDRLFLRVNDGLNSELPRRVINGDNKVDTLQVDEKHKFTPRYSWHFDQILRTLKILTDYDRSLVKFIKSHLQGGDNTNLRSLAHVLYLLTYANREKYSEEYTRRLFGSERTLLSSEFHKWDQNTTKGGQKRLWAALRDYVKHDKLLKCIEENFPGWQYYVDKSDLELPGDIWNNRFFEYLVYDLAKKEGIDVEKVNSSTLARSIYNSIKKREVSTSFHPEQLDVSFDFASRMCSNELCDICIFGDNGAADFCSEPGSSKLCPVLLILAGYRQCCTIEDCPIIANTGIRLCKGQSARQTI